MNNIKAINWVWRHGPAKPLERSVLCVFAGHKNRETGTAWPSARTVAEFTGLSLRAVRSAIAALVEGGFLEVEQRGGGRQMVTVYRVKSREEEEEQTAPEVKNSAQDAPFDGPNGAQAALFPLEPRESRSPFAAGNSAPHVRNGAPHVKNSAQRAPELRGTIEEPPKSERARKPETPLPPDWTPSPDLIAFARESGIANVSDEIELFRNYHLEHDNRRRDWSGSWRSWCLRDKKKRSGGAGGKPSTVQPNRPDPALEQIFRCA